MKKYYLIAFVYLFVQSYLWAQCDLACYHADPDASEREHNVDITNMKVEVLFDATNKMGGKVIGKVTHSLVPLQKKVDSIFFDAPGIVIKKAELDGKAISFKTNSSGVTAFFASPLQWDKNYQIVFEYEATPRKGLYFIGWNAKENTDKPDLFHIRKQIWTQGQGIDNRHWIPMYDNMNDKFTTETVITFHKDYKVLSNGRLLSQKANKDETITWHYKLEKPHAGYLLMMAIGKYEIKQTKTTRGTPVNFWYYPEFKDRVELTSLHTEKMIEFLEDETGYPYPWGSYSQVMVQDFLYGAMENTSATIFGDFFFVNNKAFEDRNYIGVNCHELTHQWFGDLITARGNSDIWLQENFATFYAKWFYGILPEHGMDEVKWNQLGEFNSAHRAAEKDNYPIRHTKSGTARAYPKGSSVLQMLRYVVGDEEFKRAVKFYLEKNAFKNVEAVDFKNAFMDKLGINLDWFFDQWVLRGGEPHYKVNYTLADKKTVVTVEQIHKMDAVIKEFKMPIQFAVYYTDGSVDRQKTMVDKAFQQVEIANPNNKKVSFVVFDENYEILKKLSFERTYNELAEQVIRGKNMADRYEATLALSAFPMSDKKLLLERVVQNTNEFYAVRAEALKQWLQGNKENGVLPKFDLAKEHKSVRQTLALYLNPSQPSQRQMLEQLLSDNSYQVMETALDNLCNNLELKKQSEYSTWVNSWLKKVENEEGMNKALRIKFLEYSSLNTPNVASMQGDKYAEYMKELVNYSSANYEFRTRVAALQALKRLGFINQEMIDNMLDAIANTNGRLAAPAKDVLDFFRGIHMYKNLIAAQIEAQPLHVKEHLRSRGVF